MPNRLAQEQSLYLRQHADNPVQWYPWGEAAFAEARKLDRPVLVSIGYSACHWCHVMARECFEDSYIADLMNRHFINIKVDREEHPEVDHLYMEAVQMITRHGGWPLHAFCLPDGRPFFGGTYFPPEDRGGGIVPWPQVLMRVADRFRRQRADLEENAEAILKNIEHADSTITRPEERPGWNPQFLTAVAEAICKQHDDQNGGFGDAPKFPQPMTIDFLLQMRATHRAETQPALRTRLDQVITHSLQAMATGGIYDQIGGGFARYSTDRYWLIPHFEKMLSDNGLLLEVYAKAYRRYRDPLFAAVMREVMRWMDREMTGKEGLFFTALDADSDGGEGRFYVWRPEEILEILGEGAEAEAFLSVYGISPEGNFEDGASQPSLLSADRQQRESLSTVREKLYVARERRARPQCDTKRMLSWNALAIRGRIEASLALHDLDGVAREGQRLEWIWSHLRQPDGGFAALYYEEGGPRKAATLPDCAFLLETTLSYTARADLIEPGSATRWIDRCCQLAAMIRERFSDPTGPGYTYTGPEDRLLAQRRQEWVDQAVPSGNSSLLHAMASLHVLTGDSAWLQEFERLRPAAIRVASRLPTGASHAMAGLASEATGIQVVKARSAKALQEIDQLLRQRPWRRCFLLIDSDLPADNPYLLCTGTQCGPPTAEAGTIADQVARAPEKSHE